MPRQKRIERLVAANVTETILLRFSRLTSPSLCRRIVQERSSGLSDECLDAKAEGVAFAVRSALGYWQTTGSTLNAKVLTRYYALLQASIAEQVASSDPTADLAAVQRHTEQGHGLNALHDTAGSFPDKYYVFARASGHFAQYAKSLGVDLDGIAVESLPKKWEKVKEHDRGKAISLADLLLRVPELSTIAEECLQKRPLCFPIAHSSKNVSNRRTKAAPGEMTTTYASVLVDPTKAPKDWIESLGLPFKNFEVVADNVTKEEHWVGSLVHPAEDFWWSHFDHYSSDYCGKSIIAPFWGTTDPLLLHLMILYALSIVVRYLPSLWHRVEHGDLDNLRVLIEHYLHIFDHIGPAMAVERITNTELEVVTRGSFNAPI